ncbi:hypothetical protein HBI56_075960 [Parastagonospora nodorum]|nr:hypothetical protein HBH53_138660 [Parastagonospora nodorum]KAH3984164.1 hypothetical protein HBH52_061290 [Parastagonospora nodorum]KAH3985936.1 hypothetical protein HBH51_020120 [Parastagonospora nodorum]KAH4003862.1 hypothetical protein HBI10_059280 [Parastagonospora nodorum]KAH4028996.1 hypothetical protein HBI13_043080 [Parastagonospora nodorum]
MDSTAPISRRVGVAEHKKGHSIGLLGCGSNVSCGNGSNFLALKHAPHACCIFWVVRLPVTKPKLTTTWTTEGTALAIQSMSTQPLIRRLRIWPWQ